MIDTSDIFIGANSSGVSRWQPLCACADVSQVKGVAIGFGETKPMMFAHYYFIIRSDYCG